MAATDLTARSDRAIERAAALAAQWSAKLFVVHASEHSTAGSEDPACPPEPLVLARERLREDVGARWPSAGLVVEQGKAAGVILDVVASLGAHLVVTGVAHHEFLGTSRLGSTVEALAGRTRVPLLVVKTRPNHTYEHVAVAWDGSRRCDSTLLAAADLVANARITVLQALDMPYGTYAHHGPALRARGRELAEAEARERLRTFSLRARELRIVAEYGHPDKLLAELTRSVPVDLVVVGRERGRLAAMLLGSVSRSVLSHVPTDVMVVPSKAMRVQDERGLVYR